MSIEILKSDHAHNLKKESVKQWKGLVGLVFMAYQAL